MGKHHVTVTKSQKYDIGHVTVTTYDEVDI